MGRNDGEGEMRWKRFEGAESYTALLIDGTASVHTDERSSSLNTMRQPGPGLSGTIADCPKPSELVISRHLSGLSTVFRCSVVISYVQ